MSSICSSRLRIRFASRLALPLAVWLAARPAAAQQDERLVDRLARLVAAADTRVYDAALFRAALRDPDPFVRRQAALAAGRIGDPAAGDPLIVTLGDSSAAVQAAAAFALGLLKLPAALGPLGALARAVPHGAEGAPQVEAVGAIAKTGGDTAAALLDDFLAPGGVPAGSPAPLQRAALLEAWRLGARAPIARLLQYVGTVDPVARRNAVYSLARLRTARGVAALIAAFNDPDAAVRAAALRGISRALGDSARLDPGDVTSRIRSLLAERDPHVRINALRAVASYHDSALAPAALPLVSDADVNVAVQAETTLGVLGGARAATALSAGLSSAVFALRRQAAIALAQADSAAGAAAARQLAQAADWRWRSVAAEAFAAARDQAGLGALLGDADGRVVVQALQGLTRIASDGDTLLRERARRLLQHPDAGVRSVAADWIARLPWAGDVDRLVAAYLRAAGDTFDDARLSAVAALAAIAAADSSGRTAVRTRFVERVPRADDYLVRRLAAARLPDAAARWGPAAPIATGRTLDDYRALVRRYLLPARHGGAGPRVTLETEHGPIAIELLPADAPLTVAAFVSLVERGYFDGSRWHRVVPNFVVQDGDPRGDGWGGPGFLLRDEVNPVRYDTGAVGMALSGPDTGGSQFFITYSAEPHLDGVYTVFGRVTAGLDALGAIAQGDVIRSINY